MAKPTWYEEEEKKVMNADWEALEPGGHKLVIRKIEMTTSRAGNDMYVIHFDTTPDDRQPGYYSNAYVNDTRDNKVWPGRTWYVIDEKVNTPGKDGEPNYYGRKNLVRFTNAIEASNDGYIVNWDFPSTAINFLDQFIGKKIGGVFRKEYYIKNDGKTGSSTKLVYFRKIEGVEEADIPEEGKKPGEEETKKPEVNSYGFMNIADSLGEEGLPFNA